MFGKYFDNRTHQHFIHTYSRVPYLDSQIFDIQTQILRESRRIKNRTDTANAAIERTRLKSQQLSKNLKQSRIKREQQQKSFIIQLQKSQNICLQKQKNSWNQFTAEKTNHKSNYIKDQTYLEDKLKSNSTKAASRLMSVRRWD